MKSDATLMTYGLLSHLKETREANKSDILEIFVPIVKKAIVEYARDEGRTQVMGKSIVELHNKVQNYFGIQIPISVIDLILKKIKNELSDSNCFTYNQDKSFIINAFMFSEIDNDIEAEKNNINFLKDDFKKFCRQNGEKIRFSELIEFIEIQKIDLFATKSTKDLDFNYLIPKYLKKSMKNQRLFGILSDIYLGGIIASYFEFKISSPVTNTILLIDTNFYVSLVDLNTHEAYLSCKQLYDLCNTLGFKFKILYSTIEQIKVLLSNRISDFESRDIGFMKEADVFGACIRRNLSKTDLERIKDRIDSDIRAKNVEIVHEVQIRDLVAEAKQSPKYKELLSVRKNQALSALNDTIAFHYVTKHRGDSINEFSDVKCWFLNNSYNHNYSDSNKKMHERIRINAHELLSLLWLSNPNQNIDSSILASGGMSSYITKYRNNKLPSEDLIRDINTRTKNALRIGKINEADVYSICIRMAEGQLSDTDAHEIEKLSDEDFINRIKSYSSISELVAKNQVDQEKKIEDQQAMIEILLGEQKEIKYQNSLNDYNIEMKKEIDPILKKRSNRILLISTVYFVSVLTLCTMWILNHFHVNLLPGWLSTTLGLIGFIFLSFGIRFIDHKTLKDHIAFTISKQSRRRIQSEIEMELQAQFKKKKSPPNKY